MARTQDHKSERIARRLARAGLCSRREAERWIAAGRVHVNGVLLESPARDVSAEDRILVDGKSLPAPERVRLFLHHKPAGRVTSAQDEKGRPTVFAGLPEGLPRLISVGRLDMNTEGLLLLTNDGDLARYLELPATGWKRRYRARAYGVLDPGRLSALEKGVSIGGVRYAPAEIVLERQQGMNNWLSVTLREGKNREVRALLESAGLTVNRLIRTAYGPFQLGSLPRGAVEEVRPKVLKDQIPKFFGNHLSDVR